MGFLGALLRVVVGRIRWLLGMGWFDMDLVIMLMVGALLGDFPTLNFYL